MDAKNNNHHTLFITLIIVLFVLLIVAMSKARSYGSELGFNESEVSGNEEVNEDIETNSEERASVSFNETDKKSISISEDLLGEDKKVIDGISLEAVSEDKSSNEVVILRSVSYVEMQQQTQRNLNVSTRTLIFSSNTANFVYYIPLNSGVTYNISCTGACIIFDSLERNSVGVAFASGGNYTPSYNQYVVCHSNQTLYVYVVENTEDPSGNDPSGNNPEDPSGNDPEEPSGNDPSGNDPSGNNPSGGGIELDGDLQGYLINYFGYKDYTVYDSEETFKNKKFFVSRYEYEVLKSLDDIKILLLCNVGILMVILFNGRRKRNAGT